MTIIEKKEHNTEDVTNDEIITEAMRTEVKFKMPAEEPQYQRTSRITFMNESLIVINI